MFKTRIPTTIIRHEIQSDNIVNILPLWGAPGFQSKDSRTQNYSIQSIQLGGQQVGQMRTSEMIDLKDNPERILFLDGVAATTCSSLYVPIQHMDIFPKAEKIAKQHFPDTETKYFQGMTQWTMLATYTLDKGISFPFDIKNPDGYDFYIMMTNSMDMSYSMHIFGIWVRREGGIEIYTSEKSFRHRRKNPDPNELIEDAIGAFERVVLNHKAPLINWERLMSKPFDPKMLIMVANKMIISQHEANHFESWGYRLTRGDEAKWNNFEFIPNSPKEIKNGWDLLLACSSMAQIATTTWRHWEIVKSAPSYVEDAIGRYI